MCKTRRVSSATIIKCSAHQEAAAHYTWKEYQTNWGEASPEAHSILVARCSGPVVAPGGTCAGERLAAPRRRAPRVEDGLPGRELGYGSVDVSAVARLGGALVQPRDDLRRSKKCAVNALTAAEEVMLLVTRFSALALPPGSSSAGQPPEHLHGCSREGHEVATKNGTPARIGHGLPPDRQSKSVSR